jgi:hypothetical protein
MTEIPCKCGHSTAYHINSKLTCLHDSHMNMWIGPEEKFCDFYIPDNLLYIEQVAKEKGLI